jgi:hypothetical protein
MQSDEAIGSDTGQSNSGLLQHTAVQRGIAVIRR